MIGINKKYDDTILDIVVESNELAPSKRNELYASDSTDKIKHCMMCLLSTLNNSLKKTQNKIINPMRDVINKNPKLLKLSGTPA